MAEKKAFNDVYQTLMRKAIPRTGQRKSGSMRTRWFEELNDKFNCWHERS